MMSLSDTDDLIHGLARQAGTRRFPSAGAFRLALIVATVAALCLAVVGVLLLDGVRPDFAAAASRAPFVYKVVCMLALGLGGLVMASRAALPGSGRVTALALVPAVALLVFRAATDRSGLSLMGNSDVSPFGCVVTILAVSLPPLVLLLGVMRAGAPTRPALAGAIIGMLSGALGAGAYALACTNDAGLFVALWYSLAVLTMAALGAVIGRRALAW
ncbi:MAG TPA: NrsF family protein [Acetobacteraceae bacterium]|nr:NrsF family protein [Acetobacteraceae bacterium]